MKTSLLTLTAALAACRATPTPSEEAEENHCANQSGDAWCEERYGGARPYCVRGACGPTFEQAGCVEEQPADEACYSPCGGRMSASEDDSCLEGEDSGSSGSGSTTGESTGSETGSTGTTTGEMPCFGDEDCEDADTGGGIEYLCSLPYQEAHYTLDHAYISKVMKATKGKILPAAELMGIDRGTLRSRLQELGLYSTG